MIDEEADVCQCHECCRFAAISKQKEEPPSHCCLPTIWASDVLNTPFPTMPAAGPLRQIAPWVG